MAIYRLALPVASLLLVLFLAVLPWGFSDTGRLALVLAPGIVIFYWSARPSPALSAFAVFCCGLVLDVFSGDALGHWALVYLVAYGVSVVAYQREVAIFGILGTAFPFVVAGMVAALCGLQVFVFGKPILVWPTVGGAGVVVLAYPVVCGVLRLFEGRSRWRDGSLERLG